MMNNDHGYCCWSTTKVYLFYFIVIFSVLDPQQKTAHGHNETLLRNITNLLNSILNHYDKKFRPNFDEKGPY